MIEELSDPQIDRYARHLVLPEIGEEGQIKLLSSRVLVIGAGGLGSPLLAYLAAAGVGTIGIVDDDMVDLSNLQRQVLHDTSRVGQAKVQSAAARLAEINPEVKVIQHAERLTRDNVERLVNDYDLVADGSDNFSTRYLVNDACYFAKKPLVSAAILRFDGQLSTYKAYEDAASPCYRCVFGDQPEDLKESCADVGVLGALAGAMGTLQAVEVVKELLGIGQSMSGRLLLYEALGAAFHTISVKADPSCHLCGPQATIRGLDQVDYGTSEPTCAA
ncbi:MAG: molybdopterin-synthase adenylyltransferase MoeB [Pseudomonadota bacterium]